MKTIRILTAVALTALLLAAAQWAVRDCPVAPLVYENCIWLAVRDTLHLPQSKFLRAAVLEIVGLALALGLYVTWRRVFPWRSRTEKRALAIAEILELERQALRVLCEGGLDRQTAQALLTGYRWRDQVHQAIFQIVIGTPSLSPQLLRTQLPARLTNAGYPDFPWEEFFQPESVSKKEAEKLLRELVEHSH